MIIDVNITTDKKSVIIKDQTDWTEENYALDDLTSIKLYFYTDSLESADDTYQLTSLELSEYTAVGEITLSFETIFGRTYAIDNWYTVKLTGNSDTYESNLTGFGSDVYITYKVFSNINDLRTPEEYRGDIEPLAMQVMFLDTMKYLDTSTINNRSIKWKKRFDILTRLNS